MVGVNQHVVRHGRRCGQSWDMLLFQQRQWHANVFSMMELQLCHTMLRACEKIYKWIKMQMGCAKCRWESHPSPHERQHQRKTKNHASCKLPNEMKMDWHLEESCWWMHRSHFLIPVTLSALIACGCAHAQALVKLMGCNCQQLKSGFYLHAKCWQGGWTEEVWVERVVVQAPVGKTESINHLLLLQRKR